MNKAYRRNDFGFKQPVHESRAAQRAREQRIKALARINHHRAKMDKVREQLQSSRHGSHEHIEARICLALGVTLEDVRSKSERRLIVIARHAIMYWTVRITGMSRRQLALKLERSKFMVEKSVLCHIDKREKEGKTRARITRHLEIVPFIADAGASPLSCFECGSKDLQIYASRPRENAIRRYRRCLVCASAFQVDEPPQRGRYKRRGGGQVG